MSQVFKAIVIDDEPAARRIMKSLLSAYADTVSVIEEAGNGREAIEKLKRWSRIWSFGYTNARPDRLWSDRTAYT